MIECYLQADEETVVQLPAGKIRGHLLKSERDNPYYAFQEIPYAAPPVGTNRFQVIKIMCFILMLGKINYFVDQETQRLGIGTKMLSAREAHFHD